MTKYYFCHNPNNWLKKHLLGVPVAIQICQIQYWFRWFLVFEALRLGELGVGHFSESGDVVTVQLVAAIDRWCIFAGFVVDDGHATCRHVGRLKETFE